jgi:hypothetical protein
MKAGSNPGIRVSIGAVVPGTAKIVGAGTPETGHLKVEVDRAAQLLHDTFGVAVEKRYNSNGRSGGAFIVTDGTAIGIGSNSSVGISVSMTQTSDLSFHVLVGAPYLRDPALATCGVPDRKYAWHSTASVDEAQRWIADNTSVGQLASGSSQ